MRYIATKQNSDGSFDRVGMNQRMIFEGRSFTQVLRRVSIWAKSTPFEIEEMDSGRKVWPKKDFSPVEEIICEPDWTNPALRALIRQKFPLG